MYFKKTPPVYDVKNMTAPVVLFWGDKDWLADPKVCRIQFQNKKSVNYKKKI